MTEKSIKDLTGMISKMAANSPKIQSDVEEIRKVICGDFLEYINADKEGGDKKEKGDLSNILKEQTEIRKKSDGTLSKIKDNLSSVFNKIHNSFDKFVDGFKKKDDDEKKGIGSLKESFNKFFDRFKKNDDKKDGDSKNEGILKKIYDRIGKIKFDKLGGKSIGSKREHGLSGENFENNKRVKTGLEGLSRGLDLMEKLRNIKLEDILFAKKKMEFVKGIVERAKEMFSMFKSTKEAQDTISFAESSIKLSKKLAKLWLISKPAKLGMTALETIVLGKMGKGGLLSLFDALDNNKKKIEKGKKHGKSVLVFCGSMFLSSVALAGIAAVGPVSILGAIITLGIVTVLTGAFWIMSKAKGDIVKGSVAFAVMSLGIVAFGFGFKKLREAVEGITLEEAGIMAGAVLSTVLMVAGMSLLIAPVTFGAITLGLAGGAIGLLGLALEPWRKFDSKTPIENIKGAVNGLSEALGLNLGGGEGDDNSFTGSIEHALASPFQLIGALFDFGKTFFTMASLLMAGVALGLLSLTLHAWDNYDGGTAIKNIENAIYNLKSALGMNPKEKKEDENKGWKENAWEGIKSFGGDILGVGTAFLQMGKSMFEMATMLIVIASLDLIRLGLMPWENYNGKNAIDNISYALSRLKNVFGMNTKAGDDIVNSKEGGAWDKLKSFGSKVVGKIGNAVSYIANMGKLFSDLTFIMAGLGLMDVVKKELQPWDRYKSENAVNHIDDAIKGLRRVFVSTSDNSADNKSYVKAKKEIENLAKVAEISVRIQKALSNWNSFKAEEPITNLSVAIVKMNEMMSSDSITVKKFDSLHFKAITDDFYDGVESLYKASKRSKRVYEGMTKLRSAFSKWGPKAYSSSIYMKSSLNKVNEALKEINGSDTKKKSKTLMKLFKTMSKSKIKQKYSSIPIQDSVDAINALDISKAIVMKDLFDSFSRIKDRKPFDRFNKAVDKFVDGCTYIVDSLNDITYSNDPKYMSLPQYNANENKNIDAYTGPSGRPQNVSMNGGVEIANFDQLATAIAQKLKNLNVRINPNMIDVNLVAEGVSGKTVRLTLKD